MIHEYPEYYTEFECIGGKCTDSCCIGWELDIDDETYDYYKNVKGEFGDRLRASMKSEEDNTFVLGNNGRCPFLNSDNLCDIYTNLGEESLCSVCTEFPRSHENSGNYRQSDVGMACPEAARLIFSNTGHTKYLVHRDRYRNNEDIDRDEKKRLKIILDIRNAFIKIIQYDKPEVSWRDKAMYMSECSRKLQEYWNSGDYGRIKSYIRHIDYKKICGSDTVIKAGDSNNGLLDIIERLELLDDTLVKYVNRYREIYDEELWEKFIRERTSSYNMWMEQIMSYYIFRYFIRALYDNNIHTKVIMAVYSCIVTECMDYVCWHDNNYIFTVDDRIRIAQKYAKEIEHSEENLEYLEEEFIFMG